MRRIIFYALAVVLICVCFEIRISDLEQRVVGVEGHEERLLNLLEKLVDNKSQPDIL